MRLHEATYRVYEILPVHTSVPVSKVWRKVAGLHVSDRHAAQRVLDELAILSATDWLDRTKLDQGDGTFLWGFQRKLTAWRLRVALSQAPNGWLPHGTATQIIADAYYQRLTAKYPRVVQVDGRWVKVGGESHAA